MQKTDHILTLSCPDRPGLVAAVTTMLAEYGGNILDSQQFNDCESGHFFMRIVFALEGQIDTLRTAIASFAAQNAMTWAHRRSDTKRKVLLLVSKLDHCLIDLLYRTRTGELNMDIIGIASNHPRAALTSALLADIPYHYFPVTPATKTIQEAQLQQLILDSGAELIVLARYMQILSNELANFLAIRCINIHHSFLPGFKGAKPYHQAFARGVKIIGATAHYVTADLDEGPIIHQDVEAISHSDTAENLIRKGRDIERRVLARAVRYHLEDRVMLNGKKTIVFRD